MYDKMIKESGLTQEEYENLAKAQLAPIIRKKLIELKFDNDEEKFLDLVLESKKQYAIKFE